MSIVSSIPFNLLKIRCVCHRWTTHELIPFQSQNDYMREWLPRRREYISEILQAEGRPADSSCVICRQRDGIWKCLDCTGRPTQCRFCCVKTHTCLPFHRVEKWNGSFFKPTWLWKAGVVIRLGHSGLPCPMATNETELNSPHDLDHGSCAEENDFTNGTDGRGNPLLTIVDKSGVHTVAVQWCYCPGSPAHDLQLLRVQMFAASFKTIKTAFTFQLLDDFLTDNRECKTSAMNYFNKLRRLTTNTFPHNVPVGLHTCISSLITSVYEGQIP
jgi:hypothetical protein